VTTAAGLAPPCRIAYRRGAGQLEQLQRLDRDVRSGRVFIPGGRVTGVDAQQAVAVVVAGVLVLAVLGLGVQQLVRLLRGRNGEDGPVIKLRLELAEARGQLNRVIGQLEEQKRLADTDRSENAQARHALADRIAAQLAAIDERLREVETGVAWIRGARKPPGGTP
jgi:hypothetical protein